jgi:hypothetical protein
MNIFTQYFSKNSKNNDRKYAEITRDLLRREAVIGGQMFGPLPKGASRQFFQLEKHTWVWVEQWTIKGQRHTKTTKYLVKPAELLKSVNGGHYERTSLQEAKNFESAVHLYVESVDSKMYSNTILNS